MNQFYWSELNQFVSLRITPKEQITSAAYELSKALRDQSLVLLLHDNLHSKINDLCDIFKAATKNILLNKPKPINKEINKTLNKHLPTKYPRVIDCNISKLDSTSCPTIRRTVPSDDYCLRVSSYLALSPSIA